MSEPDDPELSPESFTWAQLQAEGRFDSYGEFTLDYQKSHSSLAKFFRPEGSDFLHFLLRFAISSSVGEILFDTDHQRFVIDFGEANFTPDDLDKIWTSGQRNLRYLAMGLAGAWVQGVTQISLETPTFSVNFSSSSYTAERSTRSGAATKCETPAVDSSQALASGSVQKMARSCWLSGICLAAKNFDLSGFDHSFRELKRHETQYRSLGSWLINLFRPKDQKRESGKVNIVSEQQPRFCIRFKSPNTGDSHLDLSTQIALPHLKMVVDGLALESSEVDGLPPIELYVESPQAELDLSLCNVINSIGKDEFKSIRERVFESLYTHVSGNNFSDAKTPTVPIGILEWVVSQLWGLKRYREAERFCKLAIAHYSGLHPILCAMRERIAAIGFLEFGVFQGPHPLFSGDRGWKKLIDVTHYQVGHLENCLNNMLDRGFFDFEAPVFVKAGMAQMNARMKLSIYRHRICVVCLKGVVDQDLLVDYEDSGYSSLAASFLVASYLLSWFKQIESKSGLAFEDLDSSLLSTIYSASAICCCQLLKLSNSDHPEVPLRPTDREGMWELTVQLSNQARTLAADKKNRTPQVNGVMPELFVLEAIARARRGDSNRSKVMLVEASRWPARIYEQLSKEAKDWLEQERWNWAKSGIASN